MPLKHADVWNAIDRLAELHGLSVSALALKAKLSSTVFNLSKRQFKNRKRWPSTESIAAILQATGASLDEFVALAAGDAAPRATLPLLALNAASAKSAFDEQGHPSGRAWEEMNFPKLADAHAFAIEVTGKSLQPVCREGDRIVVSPAERPRKGDRVVVRTAKGEMLVRELGRDNAQKIELLALDGDGEITLSPKDIEWMYRVVWVSQ
jgi:phage repressor protein C with HTH and peptisase S24 domain